MISQLAGIIVAVFTIGFVYYRLTLSIFRILAKYWSGDRTISTDSRISQETH